MALEPFDMALETSDEIALGSFEDAPDAETVLWAVRGLNASRVGVSAEDVVQFLAKDTTLSARYECDDVGVLLDSLAADGMITYEPTTGEWAAIDADPASIGARATEPAPDEAASRALDADHSSAEAFAGRRRRSSDLDARPATRPGEAGGVPFLRLRIDELEREREEVGSERDRWRRRAESAEEAADKAREVAAELKARVRELEHGLDRERAAVSERWDLTRRAAVALARAQQELERLEPAPRDAQPLGPAADDGGHPQPTRPRRAFRGNWLE